MDSGIEHRNGYTVLGIQASVKQGSESSELFASIWERFESEREILESLSVGKKYYGVNFPADKEGLSEYIAGMMVSDDSPVPDGLVKRSVPEGEYAIFECPVDRIGFCYQKIFTTWLPVASVLFNPGNPVFEEYPEEDSTLPVRLHIPVMEKIPTHKTKAD